MPGYDIYIYDFTIQLLLGLWDDLGRWMLEEFWSILLEADLLDLKEF